MAISGILIVRVEFFFHMNSYIVIVAIVEDK